MTALFLAPISHSLPVMARRRPPDAALVPRTRNRPGELDRFDQGARLLHAAIEQRFVAGRSRLTQHLFTADAVHEVAVGPERCG